MRPALTDQRPRPAEAARVAAHRVPTRSFPVNRPAGGGTPRVLLVGPLPSEHDVVGGTKVAFAAMVEALSGSPELEVDVFDITRARAGRGPVRRAADEARTLLRLLARILLGRPRPDVVVFNASTGGVLRSGPLVHLACRLRRAKVVLRLFGGDLDIAVDAAPAVLRWFFHRVTQRADVVMVETRALCDHFGDRSAAADRLRWWPNTRDMGPAPDRADGPARSFLFLGQLRREKGVAEAIEASRALPEGCTLTVVGPAMPGFDVTTMDLGPRCERRGAVSPDEVPALLAEHDVLVLPTYHEGEGMAGIAIEAMQLGMPVIGSRWRAVPEYVIDGESGLLVEPRDVGSVRDAMVRLAGDAALMARLRRGALEVGGRFRAEAWEPKLVRWLRELAGADPAS